MDSDSKELVKAAAEGTAAGVTGEFLDKLGGFGVESADLIRDRVRFARAKAQLKMLDKTVALLKERNISPKRVAWKLLFPLLDFSALEDEDDDDMVARWAALLTNAAAGPDRGATVLPSFPRILAELSAEEAAILDVLYVPVDPAQVPSLFHI